MLEKLRFLLNGAINQVSQLRMALGIVGIASAIAMSSIVLKDHLSNIGGVVVAINMGVLLMFAILMFVAASKAKGDTGKSYQKLYFIIVCVFSLILLVSAVLSLTSVFYKTPLDFNSLSGSQAVVETFEGDYRIEESVIYFDLSKRIKTKGMKDIESKVLRSRIDRVVRQRPIENPYKIQSGTNGLRIENISSSTHNSMKTEKVESGRFSSTTKLTYIHKISANRFPIGEIVDVNLDVVFVNAFSGEREEWLGTCPNIDTKELTILVKFPDNKLCKKAWAMEQPTGNSEIAFRGNSKPVIQDNGKLVTWTIRNPSKGIGYFIAFNW